MRRRAIVCLLLVGCSYDYARLRKEDGGTTGAAGATMGAAGTGGGSTGAAGTAATAGAGGGTGAIGAAGIGGAGRGGSSSGVAGAAVGSGGAGTGGLAGSLGARGGIGGAMGGSSGFGGENTAGASGKGGAGGTAGIAGSGAVAGRGGNTGTAGVAGSGGTIGSAGRGGSIGTGGVSGVGGAVGAGGTIGGVNPCSGLCANPTSVPANTSSGDLGTGATCQAVLGNSGAVVCGNFQSPRTLTINGASSDCPSSQNATLPAPRNGGWCFQASAGNYSYAYIATYSVTTGGTAGTTGTGGASGMNACPLGGTLDCTAGGLLTLAPDGQVTDFSTADWNNTTGKWCDVHGLDGGVYAYAGTGSSAAAAVDATAHNLKLNFTVTAGQYAGGGISFDSCVNSSAFNAVQFTASITAGSLSGCTWQVAVNTQDQRPTTATNPSGGTCSSNCDRWPTYAIAAAPTTPTTITAPFSGFSNPSGSAISTRTQMVGLSWQVNSSAGTGTCDVEMRIDDIKVVTQ